ncbi:M28 family peptidase [Metabacillus fastidiosus]|uniref:M28 family peptidase n=1 Tax=Metabacillus fastidiosus TaxID=1458 RepID=A0ABU6NYY9_9BACI|nr:M28 family peptidase [Metabacillus fastidiosus]MED4402085.1 M28 family peptidase [Metabacillus fastidiosus]
MIRKTSFSILLAASLSFGGTAVWAAPAQEANLKSDQAFDNKIVKRIKAENIYNHIAELSKNPRVAGTPGEDAAVEYIKRQFESYGYKTEVQAFDIYSYIEPSLIELSVDGITFEPEPIGFTYGVNGEVTNELVYVGLGAPSDFEGKDIKGKIALIKRGTYTFTDKILNAAAAGASAVIIYNNTDGVISGTLGEPNDNYVPSLAITYDQGFALEERLKKGETVTATLKIEGAQTNKAISHNVIATKEATQKSKNQLVLVGAHHDSVDGAPGANDDASGTATVLELARVFANAPTDTDIRFVTFGAEENGLLGSYEFVKRMTDEDYYRTVGMFQMDMVGSKDAGPLIMYSADGEKNIVTDLGASAGARLSDTGEATPYGWGGRSDHVPFAEIGIPAALFIHAPVEPWYHSPEDTLDKISLDKLKEVSNIVGAAVYQVARPDTPALEKAKVAPKEVDYNFEERELE